MATLERFLADSAQLSPRAAPSPDAVGLVHARRRVAGMPRGQARAAAAEVEAEHDEDDGVRRRPTLQRHAMR